MSSGSAAQIKILNEIPMTRSAFPDGFKSVKMNKDTKYINNNTKKTILLSGPYLKITKAKILANILTKLIINYCAIKKDNVTKK